MITHVADNKRASYSFLAISPNELQIDVSVHVSEKLYLQSNFRVDARCEADQVPLQTLVKALPLADTKKNLEGVVATLDGWLQRNKEYKDLQVGVRWPQTYKDSQVKKRAEYEQSLQKTRPIQVSTE